MSKSKSTESRRTTSGDVARRANVSRTTVSFVLNGVTDQKISDATREAVLKAVRDLGYRPNRAARALVSGTSNTVIAVIPTSQLGEGALMLLGALTTELGQRGFSLVVWFESDDHDALGTLVRDLRPAGVFPLYGSLPAWVDGRYLYDSPSLESLHLPPNHLDAGTYAQVGYLYERGHQRVGYVGVSEPVMTVSDLHRHDTVVVASADLGMAAPVGVRIDAEGAAAASALQRLRTEGVTALCCYNDRIAFMMIHAMRQAGLRCPDDLAVIGYDAIPLSAWSAPPLTSVAWDPVETAAAFADLLLDSLQLPSPPRTRPQEPPRVEIVERESA
ncbi:LacI family DNA-binding transcriptional regulator (plasmid) [Arthrobacter sp. G.S.26]|uniref:LacI family DNA-binding transcriptional regulator n=1 Tax=Arthrobacter sp. G.S.26 TaxID=3433706 RepID=UPI003D783C55